METEFVLERESRTSVFFALENKREEQKKKKKKKKKKPSQIYLYGVYGAKGESNINIFRIGKQEGGTTTKRNKYKKKSIGTFA